MIFLVETATDQQIRKLIKTKIENYVQERLNREEVPRLLSDVRDCVNAVCTSFSLPKGQISLIMMEGLLAQAEQQIGTLRTLFTNTKQSANRLEQQYLERVAQKKKKE